MNKIPVDLIFITAKPFTKLKIVNGFSYDNRFPNK